MLIVQSNSTDVYRNLAVEEWLLDHAEGPVLFLYVNSPCVVIGKNQNPWRECRLSLMEAEGVPLARRISGGGAVYHDAGNLNLSVIVPRTQYREEKQYELIFQTLEATALRHSVLSRPGKSSLAIAGKKFSGNAFCHRRERTLHHGTLLVNSDLARLGRYLGPELDGIETKAVASVPAEVANLAAFAPELTVEKLSAALIEEFQTLYAPGEVTRPTVEEQIVAGRGTSPGAVEMPEAELLPMIGKNSSRDWKLGHTPKFTFQGMEVEKGRVINRPGQPLFEELIF